MSGERAGVPSVGIMTAPFTDGARLMAGALGAPGYAFVVIDHPISSATGSELDARARDALRQAAAILGVRR